MGQVFFGCKVLGNRVQGFKHEGLGFGAWDKAGEGRFRLGLLTDRRTVLPEMPGQCFHGVGPKADGVGPKAGDRPGLWWRHNSEARCFAGLGGSDSKNSGVVACRQIEIDCGRRESLASHSL